jgi:hypothetical protein
MYLKLVGDELFNTGHCFGRLRFIVKSCGNFGASSPHPERAGCRPFSWAVKLRDFYIKLFVSMKAFIFGCTYLLPNAQKCYP